MNGIIRNVDVNLKFFLLHGMSRINVDLGAHSGTFMGSEGLLSSSVEGHASPGRIFYPPDQNLRNFLNLNTDEKINLNIYIDSDGEHSTEYSLIVDGQKSEYINEIIFLPKEGKYSYYLDSLILRNTSNKIILKNGFIKNIEVSSCLFISFENFKIQKGNINGGVENELSLLSSDMGVTYLNNFTDLKLTIKQANISEIILNNVQIKRSGGRIFKALGN